MVTAQYSREQRMHCTTQTVLLTSIAIHDTTRIYWLARCKLYATPIVSRRVFRKLSDLGVHVQQ